MASSGQHDSALNERSQCANDGCNFFANETTDGLCSQCYKAKMSTLRLKSDAASPLKAEAARPVIVPEPMVAAPALVTGEDDASSPAAQQAPPSTDATPPKPPKKRCARCNKKLGLLGFECKCGGLFCAAHRIAEEHDCKVDYRSEGKKKLEAANPRIAFQKVESL